MPSALTESNVNAIMSEEYHDLCQSYIDMAIFYIMYDSKSLDEPVKMIKSIFDPKKPIEKLNVKDSTVLKLICRRNS